jgi:ATP-dependent exoDNAse (exonuclease V) beta subunit
MTDAVHDARARDEKTRAEIRSLLNRTLFVEAGAGTGKTRALVEQIVTLVLDGKPIERIVAITFTEKAAGELKDRVRGALEEARAGHAGQAEAIDAALRSLDRAQISTIHAFGLALLRNFAAESGIDPAFSMQDEVLAERRLQERWRGYLEALSDPTATAAVDRALGLGMTTQHLWTLAQELARRPGLAGQLEAQPLPQPLAPWPDVDALLAELRALPLDRAPDDDRLRVRVEALLSLVARVAGAGDERESVLAAGISSHYKSFNLSRQDVWGAATKKQVQETATAVRDTLAGVLERCRASALAGVLPLIVRFVLDDARSRAREGTLVFDDLILRPRDLLRDHPDAVRVLRSRYDVLLIDEFQDTDPLQVDIALAFATDPATGELEHGRLFLVGDPKQSIYRFRRADMAIYSATGDQLKQHGAAFPALALNRRSRAVIVDWVNSVFECIIGEGARPEIQPPYRAIEADRTDTLAGPGVARIGGQFAEPAARVRQRETSAIAAQCRAAIDEGWQVAGTDGNARPASFRDIAILIPARTILIPLERALSRAGIPYRIEGGSLIYQTQEVRDLLNCLTAIDDPADEVAVAGALRSAAFACSDVDLARHRAGGGRFNYLSSGLAERTGPVAEALRLLAEYHESRHDGSIAALVEHFVAGQGLTEIGLLVDANRDSFRRMRFVIEQARSFEAAGPESLRSFVGWLERRAGGGILDNEGAGLDDDEDAVRVLTIHRSKGLEFPIVFVAGLGSAPYHRAPVFAVDSTGGRVAVSIGAKTSKTQFELGDADTLHAIEQAHAEAELDRLLYVAATRARDHLIISIYHPDKVTKCAARRLLDGGFAGAVTPARPELPASVRPPQAPFADMEVDLPAGVTDESFEAERTAAIDRARTRRYTSATAIGAQELRKEEPQDETEPWARGRGGTHVGRAVHATIQSVALDAGAAQIAAFARAQSVAEAIPDRAGDVAALAQAALASDAAQRARSGRRALREVPFAVRYDATVLEGFIDLVIEGTDGALEIVDWKTDHISAAEVPARLIQYELQAGLYTLGLEAATGRAVTRITYVFAAPGVEASPGDPATLAAAARARLAEAIA